MATPVSSSEIQFVVHSDTSDSHGVRYDKDLAVVNR